MAPQLKINSDTLVLTKVYPIQEQKKYSHFISLEKGKAISVGRHYTNELILDDMYISRSHAAIYRSKDDNKFYIHDKNSRFGSFSSLDLPIQKLKEIFLVSSKQTFHFRIVDDKKVCSSSSGDDDITEERIESWISFNKIPEKDLYVFIVFTFLLNLYFKRRKKHLSENFNALNK